MSASSPPPGSTRQPDHPTVVVDHLDDQGRGVARLEICGGCRLQHMETGAQVARKQTVLLELLEREAGLAPEASAEPLTGPTWGYRRRARLGVKHVPKKGATLVGFREKWSPKIVDVWPALADHYANTGERTMFCLEPTGSERRLNHGQT